MHRCARSASFLLLAASAATMGCSSGGGRRTAAPGGSAPAPARSYAAAPVSAPVAGPIPFDAQDVALEQALAAARSAGKPAALYILSPTCGYCTKLLSGTLTNAGVQAEMRSYYNVRYTSTTPAGSAASRQYVRGGYPTTVVVDGSGRVMKEIVGYEDPARYAGNLRAAGR